VENFMLVTKTARGWYYAALLMVFIKRYEVFCKVITPDLTQNLGCLY